MKCISLWQPWASALFMHYEGRPIKPDETRSWPTAFRGRLAIHAARRRHVDYDPVLDRILLSVANRRFHDLPFGYLLGTVEIVSCKRASEVGSKRSGMQCMWSDYRERDDNGKLRFAWTFRDAQMLPCPVPWKGAQGFFEVPDSLFSPSAETEFQLMP